YDEKLFTKEIINKETEIDNLNKPIVGYSGVLRSYIDFELLEFLLKESDFYLVCIGYIDRSYKKKFNILKNYKNFIHIDYKPIDEIPNYVKRFNVGILPYSINNFTKSVYPLKFFEYMAMGIPIVSSALPELEKYSGIIGYSKSKEEFLENCIKAINGYYNSKFSEYEKIISENSWKKVFDKIEENLIEVYKEKGINS
ncbi:MAG: glycosyltransferase, partial [Ignavibacteria bacterium]|nr:glycosyltransferase [Ignavibacteria bacterium]